MFNSLQLIRPVNLVLIAIIQVVVQYCVISPFVGDATTFSTAQFILIVLVTVFAGAAGYVINDIYDVEIDARNKPGKNAVGTSISKANALRLYWTLILGGAIMTASLGGVYLIPGLGFYATATIALYAYSRWFKKSLLVGNLIVSLFSAMVVYVVWMSQSLAWPSTMGDTAAHDIVLMYSVFAFSSTLIREIVKDVEDMDGDARAGARTLPNVYGIPATKAIAGSLALVLLMALGYWYRQISPLLSDLSKWYYILAVSVPVGGITLMIFRATTKTHWHITSQYIKVVILLGTLFLLMI